MIRRISSLEKSEIDTKLLFFIDNYLFGRPAAVMIAKGNYRTKKDLPKMTGLNISIK
jgi:hypothetical protein